LWSMLVRVLRTNKEQNSVKLRIASFDKSWKSVQMQLLGARTAKTCGVYASHASYASEALKQVKKSNMDKTAIKDLIYGGLEELINNNRYYYHSSVSRDYSHLTDIGKQAVGEFMDIMAYKIREANEQDLDQRAKQQVIDQLKASN